MRNRRELEREAAENFDYYAEILGDAAQDEEAIANARSIGIGHHPGRDIYIYRAEQATECVKCIAKIPAGARFSSTWLNGAQVHLYAICEACMPIVKADGSVAA